MNETPENGTPAQPAALPERGEDGLYAIKLSDRTTVKIGELSGPETRAADSCASQAFEANSNRALASVRDINGTPISFDLKEPQMHINRIVGRLTGREYDRLTLYYIAITNDPETEALAKSLAVRR